MDFTTERIDDIKDVRVGDTAYFRHLTCGLKVIENDREDDEKSLYVITPKDFPFGPGNNWWPWNSAFMYAEREVPDKKQTLEEVTDMFFHPKTETLDDIIRWRLHRHHWEDIRETDLNAMKNIILKRINRTLPPQSRLTEDGVFEFTANYYAMSSEAFETLAHSIISSETTEQKIIELLHQVRGDTRVANEAE